MRSYLGSAWLLVLLAGSAAGQTNLTDASLEQLLNTQVTSVSKKEETLSRIAAAVFVINAEDIRRSGATNIPDVLRLAPGVDVQQVDASVWAISIRGFNSRYSNKVLVTIDGRSVYSPSFSGVYWDQQTLPLEEIDRIEVIRGPGATLWGANAVNGVINIFTKSAKATQGTLLSVAGGSQTETQDMAQFGAPAGRSGAYRIVGQFSDLGNSGGTAYDRWTEAYGGFRSDWDLSVRDSLTVEGGLFDNREHANLHSQWVGPPSATLFGAKARTDGGSLLARWSHTTSGGGQISAQSSYDEYRRSEFGTTERVQNFDLEFQHHLRLGSRQDIVWGLSYRSSFSGLTPGGAISFTPPSATENWFGAFVQDEIRIAGELSVTLGERIEHAGLVRGQHEPSVRISWTPGGGPNTFWASAANADRQPSRIDTSVQWDMLSAYTGPNTIATVRLLGNPQIRNEQVNDFEIGYRSAVRHDLTLDFAGFASIYDHLSTWEPHPATIIPGTVAQIISPLVFENLGKATDYGGEFALNWNAAPWWHVRPSYSYLHATLGREASSQGATTASIAQGFPQNQLQCRSMVDITRKLEFDQTVYYTARLPGGTLPGHTRLDIRLARRIGERMEASITGQNLLRNRTMEYGDSYNLVGTPALRSVYGRLSWAF